MQSKSQLTQASLFGAAMDILWGYDKPESTEAVAIASHLKTHRINAENAYEVLRIMWPDAKMEPRRDGSGLSDPEAVGYDLTFADGSRALVYGNRGMGDGVEIL